MEGGPLGTMCVVQSADGLPETRDHLHRVEPFMALESVNGVSVLGHTFTEISALLQRAGRPLTVRFVRPPRTVVSSGAAMAAVEEAQKRNAAREAKAKQIEAGHTGEQAKQHLGMQDGEQDTEQDGEQNKALDNLTPDQMGDMLKQAFQESDLEQKGWLSQVL